MTQSPPSSHLSAAQRTEITATSFSGPLPPPQILEAYNNVVPDGANRILRMAEEQSKHRMSMETHVTRSESRRADFGLGAALVVALGFLTASVVLVTAGHAIPGTLLGTFDIASLVWVFIKGDRERRDERQARMRALLERR